jgi:hypothetical protein
MILNLKAVVILGFLDFNMCSSGTIDDSHEIDLIFSTINVGSMQIYDTAQTWSTRLYVLISVPTLNCRFVFGAMKGDWLLKLALQTTFNCPSYKLITII